MVLWRPTRFSRTNTKKKKKKVLLIIRDWNAKVDSQERPGVTGKFGLGVQSGQGKVLPREPTGYSKQLLPTTQDNSIHGHHQMVNTEIDYSLCSLRWRSSIWSAKTRPRADCGWDHELLIAKFRLKLKKVGKTTRPFRYDPDDSSIKSLMIIWWRLQIDSSVVVQLIWSI